MVYNTFPLPEPSDKIREDIIIAGKKVLAARAQYPKTNLADLYDPLSIPGPLVHAHEALDRAVDRLYVGRGSINSESERLAVLFERYVEMAGDQDRAK